MSAALAGWGIKANILFAISITSDKPWDQGFRVLDKSLNRRSLRAREKKKNTCTKGKEKKYLYMLKVQCQKCIFMH